MRQSTAQHCPVLLQSCYQGVQQRLAVLCCDSGVSDDLTHHNTACPVTRTGGGGVRTSVAGHEQHRQTKPSARFLPSWHRGWGQKVMEGAGGVNDCS